VRLGKKRYECPRLEVRGLDAGRDQARAESFRGAVDATSRLIRGPGDLGLCRPLPIMLTCVSMVETPMTQLLSAGDFPVSDRTWLWRNVEARRCSRGSDQYQWRPVMWTGWEWLLSVLGGQARRPATMTLIGVECSEIKHPIPREGLAGLRVCSGTRFRSGHDFVI